MMLVVQPSLCLFDRANVLFLVAPNRLHLLLLISPLRWRLLAHPARLGLLLRLSIAARQRAKSTHFPPYPTLHLFLCFRSTFLGNLELEARFKFWPADDHSSGRTDGRLPICRTDPPCPLGGVLLILHLLGRNGRASLTREGLFCMIMPPPDRGRVGELESALRIHPRSLAGIFHLIWALCAVSPRASVNS